jgi:hypothetical protein
LSYLNTEIYHSSRELLADTNNIIHGWSVATNEFQARNVIFKFDIHLTVFLSQHEENCVQELSELGEEVPPA